MTNADTHSAACYLDECERIVQRLHKMCCEPDRSPRMQAILADIDAARALVGGAADVDSAGEVVARLEGIGAKIGHLQVACCTDARMPLYAEALKALTDTQIEISRSVGQGH